MSLPTPHAPPSGSASLPIAIPRAQDPIRRGLILALWEAAVVGAMFAALEYWLVALLDVRLGASDKQIGTLASIPVIGMCLLGPIMGLIIRAMGGNKSGAVIASLGQVACLVGLSVLLLLPRTPVVCALGLGLGIGINVMGVVGGPAWLSWMGDLIPRRMRARYQARRMRLLHITKLAFVALFAGIMHWWPAPTSHLGLMAVFAIAAVARIASTALLIMQHQPVRAPVATEAPLHLIGSQLSGLVGFVRTLHRTELGRWTLVWALLHFGMMVAGPYFQVYMLADEGVGLGLADRSVLFSILLSVSTVARIAALPLVGPMVDRMGPAAGLRIGVIGIALIPIGWAAFGANLPVVFFIEVISGLCWSFADCAVGALLFGCAGDPRQRTRLIGYHQFVVGPFIALGTWLGGVLVEDLLPHWTAAVAWFDGSPYRALFIISLILRLPAVVLAMVYLPRPHLPEHRVSGVWRAVPFAQPTYLMARGMMNYFRRDDD